MTPRIARRRQYLKPNTGPYIRWHLAIYDTLGCAVTVGKKCMDKAFTQYNDAAKYHGHKMHDFRGG